MKIPSLILLSFTLFGLNSCSHLSNMMTEFSQNDCYNLYELSENQRIAFGVGQGNPIFLIGTEQVVCPCYNGGTIEGSFEKDLLVGIAETANVAGLGEKSRFEGGEEAGRLLGSSEHATLTGGGERTQLAGLHEKDIVIGENELASIEGEGEKEKQQGQGETSILSGRTNQITCRTVPDCEGFRVDGYALKIIPTITSRGQKNLSTSCIIWW